MSFESVFFCRQWALIPAECTDSRPRGWFFPFSTGAEKQKSGLPPFLVPGAESHFLALSAAVAARERRRHRYNQPKTVGTSLSWPTEVDFVPYTELYPQADAEIGKKDRSTSPAFRETVIVPYASATSQTAPDFQKKEMPADETLRVENFYLPAYTEFTSQNIPNPNKQTK